MSTDFKPADACELLSMAAHALWKTTITGTERSPWHEELREFMHNPKPGDLVIEWTSRNKYPARERMGRLISGGGTGGVIERIFTDGKPESWDNCEFIAFPEKYL